MMKRYAFLKPAFLSWLQGSIGSKKLNQLLESLLEAERPLINAGVLSQSPAQFSSLWALREGVTEAVSKEGKAHKYDVSIPLSKFKELVDLTRERLRTKGLLHDKAVKHVIGYGHIGDGKGCNTVY